MSQNGIKSGIDKSYLDLSVNPRDDFYEYAVGGWRKKNPIPSDESSWGTFIMLRDRNRNQLHDLLRGLSKIKEIKKGSDLSKLQDFYIEAMNEEKIEKLNFSPLKEKLGLIESIKDKESLIKVISEFQKSGLSSLWGIDIDQDLKNSEKITLYIAQDGLGLPDREYYLNVDTKSEEIRKKYLKHIENILSLSGRSNIEKDAKSIFDFEKRLARKSMDRTDMRDPLKLYNKKTLKNLEVLYPEISWREYFSLLGIVPPKEVVVMQPEFLKEVNNILKKVPFENLKIFFIWKLLNGSAGLLGKAFVNVNFDFYGKVLSGIPEIKPRWKRITSFLDNAMGDVLGKLYVEKHFSGEAKRKANELVNYLFKAYEKRINSLDWMSQSTKNKALKKLHAIVRKLGYPDKWRLYKNLEIKNDSYLENYFRISEFEFKRDTKKIGKPVDRTEWHLSASTVNAYYYPSLLDIVFPAGILQSPFFSVDNDIAVNFGAIGTVIGHEITHGFDDEGGKFDSKGNLKDWWSKEDKKLFEKKTKVLEKQFNKCEALPGKFVNGKLTLGENVADLGGVSIAYDALKIYMDDHGRLPDIDGFTPEQRFFLSFAVFEAQNTRPEMVRQYLITDPHSPGQFRINVPLSNMEEFYEAFGIKEGDKMYRSPKDRAKIW